MIHKNVVTDFSPDSYSPEIDSTAFIHPLAAIIGNTKIGRRVMVSPFASIRGDGVIIHALETEEHGKPVEKNMVDYMGDKFAVYIGKRVSLAHQVQIHGPALVDDDTFVGMKSLVFKSRIGKNCVVEPGCIVMGVNVPEGRYIEAGTTLKNQNDADNLPVIDDNYPMKDMNKGVIHVNTALADGYNKAGIE